MQPDTKGKTMTDTIAPPAVAGQSVRAGMLAVGRTSDTNVSVWIYVVAVLASDRVFGVNLGTNRSIWTPEGTGARFDTFAVDQWTSGDVLTLAGQGVRDALVTFLVGAGLPDPFDSPRVQGDQDTDQAYQRGVADGRAQSDRTHEAWVSSLVSDAHEFANDHSLCSEFDRFMSEHGLPTRSRSYLVTYRVTVPNGVDPYDFDMEDLQAECEDFALSTVVEA